MTSSTEAPPESAQEAAATASEGHPASKAGHWARRRLLSRVSIQSKLIVMLLISSILSAAVVGFIGYESGRSSLRASVFDRLTQVRESQTRQLVDKITDLKNSAIIYTRGSTTIEALEAFSSAFGALATAPINPAQQQALVDYYTNDFVPSTERATGVRLDVNALLPTSNAQKYLQAYYTAPFRSSDTAIHLDDAHDGSAWSAANARYNDFFREIVSRFGFVDAALLDKAGNVVYSANKGVDLGTNILTGPYRENNLQDAYRKAMASNSAGYVAVTDFEKYQPTRDQPTAWMVTAVGPGGRTEGALALQFPITGLNRAMTTAKQWAANGLGKTGETYLAGPDDLMRSDSRLFLENPAQYKRDVVSAGTPTDVAEEAIRLGGTTLVQPVGTEAVHASQRGQTGTMITNDYLGHETLQAYAPVRLGSDLHWSIIAKIDTAEAFAPEWRFTRTLVLSTAGIVFVVCVAAMLLAQLFVRPIRKLEAGAQRISAGDYDVSIPVDSRDEIGDLTLAFNEMSRTLGIKEELLSEQRKENDRLLLSLMPEPVVQRYREGEQTIAQDHQDVTVVFADLVGLDELSDELSSDQSLAILNELVRQFDAAAEHLGVERIRTLRHGYLASCGLNIPRLDNVRRTVDFALEMQRIVDRFNSENDRNLDIRAGIDTGRVTSGLVGRSSIVYDMWGAAVNLAYQIQSGSPQPGVYVTSQVYEVMRDTRHFTSAGTTSVDGNEEPIWRLSERQP
jgi:class 3 adenylate cyclase